MSNTIDCALPCHLVDPDLFFAESPADVERAKALCLDCPLRRSCLAEALDGVSRGASGAASSSISGVVVAAQAATRPPAQVRAWSRHDRSHRHHRIQGVLR